jgi:tryptophan synthase beta chain
VTDTRILLPGSEIPGHWYNVVPDMPGPPAPYLGPDGRPVPPEAMAALFPPGIIEQEVSSERWIPIPDPVRDALALWRPTPMYRARRLEERLGTPARIYFKYEGVSPAGSHKTNSAVAQAYYNREAGVGRLTTETGAGQWGSALALAAQLFGLETRIFMVRVSHDQKPFRKSMMQLWGAEVVPSPSELTGAGRAALAQDVDAPGSLGLAISEAVEEAAGRADTNYALGSVLNHVLLHQTVIGQEARRQMELAGDYPDVIFAPCGGGSNVGGMMFPFVADKAAGRDLRLVACEPASCPTLTRGHFAYDYGDSAGLTPIMKMYTLGHEFVPPGIHAGGLRYHGDSVLVSQLYHDGVIEAVASQQVATFRAGQLVAQTMGIIPAPEAAHAAAGAIDEALRCRESGEAKTILFTLSGHGHFDMAAYDRYLAGELEDYDYPEDQVRAALGHLPRVDPEPA